VASVPSLDELTFLVYRAAAGALERPPVFLAIEGAFHGKTSGALTLTHRAEYQAPWRGLGVRSVFLPAGDTAAIDAAVRASRVPYLDLVILDDGGVDVVERVFVNIAA